MSYYCVYFSLIWESHDELFTGLVATISDSVTRVSEIARVRTTEVSGPTTQRSSRNETKPLVTRTGAT